MCNQPWGRGTAAEATAAAAAWCTPHAGVNEQIGQVPSCRTLTRLAPTPSWCSWGFRGRGCARRWAPRGSGPRRAARTGPPANHVAHGNCGRSLSMRCTAVACMQSSCSAVKTRSAPGAARLRARRPRRGALPAHHVVGQRLVDAADAHLDALPVLRESRGVQRQHHRARRAGGPREHRAYGELRRRRGEVVARAACSTQPQRRPQCACSTGPQLMLAAPSGA